MQYNFQDLTGRRFGRLMVIGRADDTAGHTAWMCRCDCGAVKTVLACNLKSGASKSCGCYRNKKTGDQFRKHGMRNTRLYQTWCGMRRRSFDKNDKSYPDYGGRGIVICDEWDGNFKAFYDWSMENGYADELTIDRIDNSKGYGPSNCRWATSIMQANNRSTSVFVEMHGEKRTVMEWCRLLNVNYGTAMTRRRRGLQGAELFAEPIGVFTERSKYVREKAVC